MFRDLELEIHYINIKNIINYEENYNFIYLPTRNRMKILITLIMRTIFRKVRTETTLKIYNTLILPTLLYGSQNWTLTASQSRGIEAAEMKLLRHLAGYTLQDHKTNDFIRRELKITAILDKIDEYRLNWHLHLQRMPQNRIPLKSYHYRPQGRRTIGRPKKRWREQL